MKIMIYKYNNFLFFLHTYHVTSRVFKYASHVTENSICRGGVESFQMVEVTDSAKKSKCMNKAEKISPTLQYATWDTVYQ